MILTGTKIHEAVQNGDISITPFNEKQLNATSYDLTLGYEVAQYALQTKHEEVFDHTEHSMPVSDWQANAQLIDCKRPTSVVKHLMDERGFMIRPGALYLMHTIESVCTSKYSPAVDGKSSIGRLGLLVHVTAGFGEPNFDGQYTLEVVSLVHSIIVYPGQRIGQIRFQTIEGEVGDHDYAVKGHYRGEAARGPVGSRTWRQFE